MAEQKKEQQEKAKEKQVPDRAAAIETEKKELVDTLQRLQAEFENYKKRAEKEKQQCISIGKAAAVSALLPVVDSFYSAIDKLKKEKNHDGGLELLNKQFFQSMQKLGLQEISAIGKKFDHETMDCMMQGNDEAMEDGIVLEEFQKGYLLDGAVLRHAKVKINKKDKGLNKAEAEKKDEAPEMKSAAQIKVGI